MIIDTDAIIEKILINEDELDKRIKELASEIDQYYEDKDEVVVVGILKGSVMFMAQLSKHMKVLSDLNFMAVSSYEGGIETTGNVKILMDLDTDIYGKNVLLVEDIIDTGLTLQRLVDNLSKRNPKEIKIVTLLDKKEKRQVDLTPDWSGFEIPNEFVVGFGLDYDQKLRNLPFIGVLKKSVYEK